MTLKPTPNTVHYILTHFKGFWNIVNSISFLRDAIMSYVLTCKLSNLQKKKKKEREREVKMFASQKLTVTFY